MKRKNRKAPPMIICACDPDTTTPAFAVFSGEKLSHWELLRGTIGKLLPEIKGIIDTWHPDLLVIENQYLPMSIDAIRRFRSLSSLISARAMITAVFVLSGVNYELVEPFSWQQTLGGSALGRDRLKALSVLKATGIAGQRIDDHNLADAINLGFWWAKSHGASNANASSKRSFRQRRP